MASPLSYLTATILGVVQGITEFLPVSSSGHVALAALFMDVPEVGIETVVALHVGTLAATILLFRQDLVGLLRCVVRPAPTQPWRQQPEALLGLAIVAACIPTALLGLLLEPVAERMVSEPVALGIGFCTTAGLLLLLRQPKTTHRSITIPIGLVIGAAQGIAVLPSLSRSGLTLVCGVLIGLPAYDAFRFSFLISIPAIAGATLLTSLRQPLSHVAWPATIWGAAIAAVVGYGALIALRHMLQQQRLWWFSLYLFPLGLAVLAWSWLSLS
jgi:undecaprenyl-diphosphatase